MFFYTVDESTESNSNHFGPFSNEVLTIGASLAEFYRPVKLVILFF